MATTKSPTDTNPHSVHIGRPETYYKWLLIWSDLQGNLYNEPISARAAQVLIAKGLRVE